MGELCTNKVLLLMNSVLSEKSQIKRIQKLGAISKQNLKKYTSIVLIYQKLFERNFVNVTF